MSDRLTLCPMPRDEANAFVVQHHRHHGRVVGYKFAVGAARGETVVGVAIVGRPVGRRADDGWTLEVTRLCSDGTRNVCSFLYAAAWRATRALGYRKLITFTLATESGTSLRAAGWRLVGSTGGKSWSQPSRPRVDKHPLQQRLRWQIAEAS